jgi:hypothetical protein
MYAHSHPFRLTGSLLMDVCTHDGRAQNSEVLELLTIPNARLNATEENKEIMERVEFYAGDWGLLTVTHTCACVRARNLQLQSVHGALMLPAAASRVDVVACRNSSRDTPTT